MEVLQSVALTTEILATVIRHGRHYQAGYLCCLAFGCFSNHFPNKSQMLVQR
jgi:hypothetical protein